MGVIPPGATGTELAPPGGVRLPPGMVSVWNGAHKAVIRALSLHCSLIYECLGRFRPDRR
jgi:hypothetical protein